MGRSFSGGLHADTHPPLTISISPTPFGSADGSNKSIVSAMPSLCP
jgi:hypothetical protein